MKSSLRRDQFGLVLAAAVLVVGFFYSTNRSENYPWPKLSDYGYVSGRPATWNDVKSKNAAISFVYDDKHRGTPMNDVTIPQFAHLKWGWLGRKRERCVLIQAELDPEGVPMYGLFDIKRQRVIAGRSSDVALLGASVP